MVKTTDLNGFLENIIIVGRQHAEMNKEQHDKERWKQTALGNHKEAMMQSGLLCGDIGSLNIFDLFEKMLKYFKEHADANGLITYDIDTKEFSIISKDSNEIKWEINK